MIKGYFKYYRLGRKFIFHSATHRRLKIHLQFSPYFSPAVAFDVYCQWETMCDEYFINKLKAIKRKRMVRMDLEFKSNGRIYIPKLYLRRDMDSRLSGLVRLSEARRNYATLCYLKENGVEVPLPLMCLEVYRTGIYEGAVLFMEMLPEEAVDYKISLHHLGEQPLGRRLGFLEDVAASLARFHNLGVYTEDTDKNMAVKKEGDRLKFYYYDFDNFYPWRKPKLSRTANAVRHYLLRKVHPFSELEIKTFIKSYVKHRECPPEWEDYLLKKIEERYPELVLAA